MPYAVRVPRYRNGYGALAALAALGAARALGSGGGVPEGAPLIGAPDGCSGLACKRVRCGALPTTRVTGRVTDPAGLRGL